MNRMRIFSDDSRIFRVLVLMLFAPVAAMLIGCGVGDPLFVTTLPPFAIVGEDENNLLFVVSKTFQRDDGLILPASIDPSELYSLSLQSGEIQLVKGGLASNGFILVGVNLGSAVVANGKWVAWTDRTSMTVRTLDRKSGTESQVLEGLDGDEGLGLVGLEGDRLVALRVTDPSANPGGYEFIVLDLRTGAETRIGDGMVYASFALAGDYFALFNDQPTNVSPVELELVTNLDVVTLSTGERKTIAPDLRISGDGGALFLSEGRVIWQQFRRHGFRSKVRSYDLASERMSTLADPFEKAERKMWLMDVDGDDLLVEADGGGLFGYATVEIRNLTGVQRVVGTIGSGLLNLDVSDPPRFVGDYVVWTQIKPATFAVYDRSSGILKSLDPLRAIEEPPIAALRGGKDGGALQD